MSKYFLIIFLATDVEVMPMENSLACRDAKIKVEKVIDKPVICVYAGDV
jgi:hypothetical protein